MWWPTVDWRNLLFRRDYMSSPKSLYVSLHSAGDPTRFPVLAQAFSRSTLITSFPQTTLNVFLPLALVAHQEDRVVDQVVDRVEDLAEDQVEEQLPQQLMDHLPRRHPPLALVLVALAPVLAVLPHHHHPRQQAALAALPPPALLAVVLPPLLQEARAVPTLGTRRALLQPR